MAHHLTIASNGVAEMAYTGETPWHGLGQHLQLGASIEEWQLAAGMAWNIERSPVQYQNGSLHTWKENEVLYRSDTNMPLALVSKDYCVVQPSAVLEFFRDLTTEHGFTIETAGTLKGGRRMWALARTNFEEEVVPNDSIRTYLLLYTSCDKGLSTNSFFTSIRAVCNNTLQMCLDESMPSTRVSVRHNTEFNPNSVKMTLGLNAGEVFTGFMSKMKTYANVSLSGAQAQEIIEQMFLDKGAKGLIRNKRGFQTVMQLFNGTGKGAQLDGVAGTGWGLVNAVTEYVDFYAPARQPENRLNNAWFGPGRDLKHSIVQLVDAY